MDPIILPPRLRALTLWPEWAWAVVHHGKRVENRTWAIPRGEWFALHAGRHIGGRSGARAEYEGSVALADMMIRAGAKGLPGRTPYKIQAEASSIVGVFRVTANDLPHCGDLGGWRVPEQVGNQFEFAPIPRVPCSGAQKLWTVPPDIAAKVRVAVAS